MEISITRVEGEEFSTLSKLAGEINRQHFPDILGAAETEEMIRLYLTPEALRAQTEKGVTWFLARADGVPAGYCAYLYEGDIFFIDKYYVKKEFRQMGIGGRMMDEMLACRGGRKIVRLTVNQGSKVAQAVYKKMGFYQIDTITMENGPAWTLYLLEKIMEEA